MNNARLFRMVLACGAMIALPVLACPPGTDDTSGGDRKAPVAVAPVADPGKGGLSLDPSNPQWKTYLEQQRKVRGAEKDLRKIRFQHFVAKKDVESRRAGLEKLRTFTDPMVYPALMSVFQDDPPEVRRGVLDHLASQQNEPADAALAWAAVYASNPGFRDDADERLLARMKGRESIPLGVQSVVAQGLDGSNRTVLGAAANLAYQLKLWEAIPMMIAGQVQGARDDADPNAVLAYIVIGTQRAFVADLNPVVGDNAIAFDPVPGVLTEGTILKVQNAVVTEYFSEVHVPLVALSTEGMGGKSTAGLGYNPKAWQQWYTQEWLPHRAAMEQRRSASDSKSAHDSQSSSQKDSSSDSSSQSNSSRQSNSSSQKSNGRN